MRHQLQHPAYRWLTLGLAPGVGLLWSRGQTLPTLMCLSLCLALAGQALAGVLAQRWIEGLRSSSAQPVRRPGLFQVLWLGQYLTFALAIIVTPAMGLLADLTGIHVPYRVSLPLLLLVLSLATLRGARTSDAPLAWPTAVSAPSAALILLALFRAMYLHSIHAGDLGHDTRQHIHWAQHIADYGFLALPARGTNLLDDYPRFFHALCAAWSALGSSPTVAPFVKVMPELQGILACAFLCELVPALLDRKTSDTEPDRALLRTILAVFVAWHMTFGDGQQIYEGNDLSGTPRLAAAWVLLGLPLLFLAHHAGTLRGASPWIWGMVPVLPTLGLGVNPVLVPVYLTYSLPVTALLAVLTCERVSLRFPTGWWRHLGSGALVSVFLSLTNSYVLHKIAHTRAGADVFARMGIRTVVAGLPDLASASPPSALCETSRVTCLADLAVAAFEDGTQKLIASVTRADFPALSGGRYALVYWLVFGAPLLVVARSWLAHAGAFSQAARSGARTFPAILIASTVPALLYPVARAFIDKLAHQNFAFSLLSTYYGSPQMFLGAWLRCLLPLSSWLLIPTSLRARLPGAGWWMIAAIGCIGLSDFQIASLTTHRNARAPWTITWPELQAIRHVDDFVPAHETIVVPALHVFHNRRENLLMPTEPVGVAATELKARTLFMVRLGTSLDFGWRDLKQRFCGKTEARRALLRSVNARWVLVRAENPRASALLEADLWRCGVTLRTLEAEHPPAWSERDLALYRINP